MQIRDMPGQNMDGLVDFFIAGTQKGGTTALDQKLRQHPLIQMADVKEVHHFDNETLDWPLTSHDNLHRHYNWSVEGVMRGDATPIYMYWPESLRRIQAYNQASKLIILLRHPTFRAYSSWRMLSKFGVDKLPFDEAISDRGRQRVSSAVGGAHRHFSYIERGFYHGQVTEALRLFDRDQILFLTTD